MKRYYMFLTFVLALCGGAKAAQAASPGCLWSYDEAPLKGPNVQAVTVGEEKSVVVAVETQGQFKVPPGWTNVRFKAGACIGFDHPDTCGTWEATRKFESVPDGGTETATFAVENAGCSPSSLTIEIPVEAATVPWTAEEKSSVTDHVENATDDNAGTGDIGVGLVWGPNLPTTTRPAWGTQIVLGLRLTPHFKIGGAVRLQWTGIPIDPALRPQTIGTTEFSHFELIRLLGVITPSDSFHLELGGEAGVGTFSYSTTFVRQDAGNQRTEWVNEDTQTQPVFGPTLALVFYPGKHVGLDFGFSALIVPDLRRNVGSGPGGTGQANTGAGKEVQVLPQALINLKYMF
jgi:hypothetical protein